MQKPDSGGNAAPEAKATPLFDTQKAVKSLREAGVSEAQAEAHVEVIKSVMNGTVATKADLVALRNENKADLKLLEVKMEAGFEATASKADHKLLVVKMEAMRNENETAFEAVATKADLRALEVRMIKWNIATLIAVVGSIIALG